MADKQIDVYVTSKGVRYTLHYNAELEEGKAVLNPGDDAGSRETIEIIKAEDENEARNTLFELLLAREREES